MASPDSYIVRCPGCGTRNRIPAAKVDERPTCGQCRSPIDLRGLFTGRPVEVTDRNFEAEVLRSPLPVLLDCWAPWCGPCRMVGPVIESLAAEWRGRIKVAKINTDENQGTAARFQIRSIPTLLVFDRGKLADTMVGALPKEQIAARMSPFLK